MYNNDMVGQQPPPAHTGIPPLHVDPKTGTRILVALLHTLYLRIREKKTSCQFGAITASKYEIWWQQF